MPVRTCFLLALSCLSFVNCTRALAQDDPAAQIDAIMETPIRAGKVAGASVAVVRKNRTIVDKSYGFADLELAVRTPPYATYEIGSLTKQFTAASILLLAEAGKLSLDDELTRFLPDYPTLGHRVTIRRLLNHTSGIKGYTELPEFQEFKMLKRPREELVKLFGAKPFEFEPGEAQIYNNSAFFLLGLIIEKISGQTWAEFVQRHLFDPVGMKDSYYCSERVIHKNHAHGYDSDGATLGLKAYIDHTWPYAGGSLCSSTRDLVLWNQALHGGKILKPESYREMTSPGALNDGTRIRYGMGVSLVSTGGRRTFRHEGAIPGFLSESEYYPDADLIIVVLLNTAGPISPRELARQIADVVLGKEPELTPPVLENLDQFIGEYAGRGRGGSAKVSITRVGSTIALRDLVRQDTPAETLKHQRDLTFGFLDTLVIFEKEGGSVIRLRLDTGSNHNVLTRISTDGK